MQGLIAAYWTLRVHDEHDGKPTTFSYSVWCTGERELYDLVQDPHQVRNLLAPLNAHAPFATFNAGSMGAGTSYNLLLSDHHQRLLHRLDALVLVLKTCVGETCHQPYKALFPDIASTGEEIYSLSQALDPRFDGYFEGLPKVKYSKCVLGYQARLEKPDWTPKLAFRASRGFVVQGLL